MPDASKVLMLVQNSFFSDSRVLRIAGSIAARGADVTLLALEGAGLPPREDVEGFHVRRLRLQSRRLSGKLSMPLKAAEYIAKAWIACLRSGARLYHVHDPLPLAPAIVASWFTGARVIYDVHELHFGQAGLSRVQAATIRIYESLTVRGVDRVIMSDGASRTFLFRRAHRYDRPIDYVYNCPAPVDYPGRALDLRDAVGIPSGSPLVVFTGHVGPGRSLQRVIEGMPAWPREAHFLMLGHALPAHRESLEAVARSLGVESRVHFFGPVPPHDVVPWLMSADVATTMIENVGPSFFNSAPTKMFEAIMARVPQIASDFPEIRRVVRDNPVGPAGELVDPAETTAISAAICRVITQSELRCSYKRNADVLARTHFNWRIEEAKLVGVYDAVLPGLLQASSDPQ